MTRLLFIAFFLLCKGFCCEPPPCYKRAIERSFLSLAPQLQKEELEALCAVANEVRAIELSYPDHYQVITAQDSLYLAYQLILEEIYDSCETPFCFLRGKSSQLSCSLNHFFVSYPCFLQTIDASLIDEQSDVHDGDSAISSELISASLGLEIACEGDSAASIFLNGVGAFQKKIGTTLSERKQRVVQHILSAIPFKVDQLGRKAIATLVNQCPSCPYGLLIQMFFPKERVGNFLYASQSYGYVDHEKNKDLPSFFARFAQSRGSDHFDPSKNYQVRVLAGALDPAVVQMHRHTLIPEQQVQKYQALIRETLYSIAQNHAMH